MINNKRVIHQERAKRRSKELVSVVAVFAQRQFLNTKRRRDIVYLIIQVDTRENVYYVER